MFFVAKICKRALRASIEGYLAVAASTPTYSSLPCVCFGFLIQILFFFQIDKSDNTTFFVAGMLTQLKIYLGHFVVNVTKILTFKYFGSNVLVRTSCKWCQPVLLEF